MTSTPGVVGGCGPGREGGHLPSPRPITAASPPPTRFTRQLPMPACINHHQLCGTSLFRLQSSTSPSVGPYTSISGCRSAKGTRRKACPQCPPPQSCSLDRHLSARSSNLADIEEMPPLRLGVWAGYASCVQSAGSRCIARWMHTQGHNALVAWHMRFMSGALSGP